MNTLGTNPDHDRPAEEDSNQAVIPENNRLKGRQKKILEYVDGALANSNPLVANMELANSDLMQMMLWLRADTERLRATLSDPLDSIQCMIPIAEQLYKLGKQLNAIVELLMR